MLCKRIRSCQDLIHVVRLNISKFAGERYEPLPELSEWMMQIHWIWYDLNISLGDALK